MASRFAERAPDRPRPRTGLLAAALCCLLCGSAAYAVPAVFVSEITGKQLRESRKQAKADAALCRDVTRHRARLHSFLETKNVEPFKLGRIGERFWYGNGCPEDRSLAIAIMTYVVGPDPLNSENREAIGQLVTYLSMSGQADDRVRSIELQRIMSLRGDYYGAFPKVQWTSEELRAFVIRDDVWAYLNRPGARTSWQAKLAFFDALSDPSSPRFDRDRSIAMGESVNATPEQKTRAARLLLSGAERPGDMDRAEALLTSAARYSEESRLLLLEMVRPRLLSSDRNVRDRTVATLSEWSDAQTPAGAAARSAMTTVIARDLSWGVADLEARTAKLLADFVILGTRDAEAPLFAWVDSALQTGGNARKGAALEVVRRLALARHPFARHILNAEFDRHGGLAQAGRFSPEQGNLAQIFTAEDYPAAALRAEEQGVVEASALIAPDGRIIAVIVTRSASPALDKAVSRLIPSRARGMTPPGYSGRYVQAPLPPIQFRLKQCERDAPADPILPGALLVQSDFCPPRPVLQTVS